MSEPDVKKVKRALRALDSQKRVVRNEVLKMFPCAFFIGKIVEEARIHAAPEESVLITRVETQELAPGKGPMYYPTFEQAKAQWESIPFSVSWVILCKNTCTLSDEQILEFAAALTKK